MSEPRHSVGAAIIPHLIRWRGSKREYSSPTASLRKADEHLIRPQSYAPPKALDRSVKLTVRQVSGWPIYTVAPKPGPIHRRALYVHGGAWVKEISPFHWRLIAELASSTGTEFTVPIYPLVPSGTAGTVVPIIADLAEALIEDVGASQVVLLGDSAGGALILSAAMLLRDRQRPAPRDIVLIAPVVDLTFTDPLIYEIEPSDPWLNVPGPAAIAQRWRGDLSIQDPLVSPVNAPLSGLGRITLFSGTRDITHADALTMARKAEAEHHPFDLHQHADMIHVYPLLPIREGAHARKLIKNVLVNTPK
ncbi:alpha/beta hydrolase fold domain-containing protein [Arthrobacter glacialis]|uniref:alpha/beta hydrolase fold domain-containing protein n=1 Tax=Arthrobacter glacialis TaxID=1664 RepID=UPI000CD40C6A|nr:alpha/beta hydrolase [Arthrobacter glacialis]POH58182.1 esterase [Arthrobacter glacialis]